MTQETRQEFSHFLWKRDAAIIMAGGVEWSLCASVDLPRSLSFPEPGLSSLREGRGHSIKRIVLDKFVSWLLPHSLLRVIWVHVPKTSLDMEDWSLYVSI